MSSIPTELNWKTLFAGDPRDGWLHSGIGIFPDGNIVFEAPGGRAFIDFNPSDGTSTKVSVDAAVLHGIFVPINSENFWICDPGVYGAPPAGQLLLVNRNGEILERITKPGADINAPIVWKPTSVAIVEEGKHKGDMWIGDGYGESLVHRIRPDGTFQTFDGSSTSIRFDCPHGLAIDTRGKEALIAIADRGNERIVFFTLEGEYVRSVKSEKMVGPSSIAVRGDRLIVTDLFGAILSVDAEDRIEILVPPIRVDRVEGWPNKLVDGTEVAPDIRDGAVNSPHGVTVSPLGEVLFTEWYFGGRVVRIY